MPRAAFNNEGTTTAAITVDLGNGAILSGTNARIALINNSDATVRGTVTVPSDVNIDEAGVDIDYVFNLHPFEYRLVQVTKSATTGNDGQISIGTGGVTTSHRTSAQDGEFIYMARVDN